MSTRLILNISKSLLIKRASQISKSNQYISRQGFCSVKLKELKKIEGSQGVINPYDPDFLIQESTDPIDVRN